MANTQGNTPKKYTALAERIPVYNGTPVPNHVQQYRERHTDALINPKPGFERAMVRMLRGWLEYAEVHETRYESEIGNDGFLGDHWQAIGKALRGLLNGECGRIDCGTIDGILLDTMKDAQIPVEE